MLIKELAEKTGLTPQTIRFYEKEGFLDTRYIRRRENNYRDYSEDAVRHLLNLKAGQAAGFTLAELKQYREAVETGEVATQQQVTFLHQKIDDINGTIAELERIRAHLTTLIQMKKVGSFCIRRHGKCPHLSDKKYRLPDNVPRCQALSADWLCHI